MSVRAKLRFGVAALAASFITGMAAPERELVFFLLLGGIAGYLSPVAQRWVDNTWGRAAAGAALGFLVCYVRIAPWMGADIPLVLEDAWAVTAVALTAKALVVFAAMEGVYARLRRDGLLGA